MNTALKIAFPAAGAENAVAATLAAARSSRLVLNAFADVFLNPAQRPIQKQAARRVRSSIPNDGLRTPQEVAARLGMSIKQVKTLALKDGELRFINTGRGSTNIRMMFAEADVEDFIKRRAIRNPPPCPSGNRKTPPTITSTSSGEVIGFTNRLNAQRDAKQKRLKNPKESG